MVITGPAETYLKFAKALKSEYKQLDSKVLAVVNNDSMTDNQLKAWFLRFFNKNLNTDKKKKWFYKQSAVIMIFIIRNTHTIDVF